MAGRPHWFTLTSVTDVPETAINTETVVATLSGVSAEFPGQTCHLSALVTITGGTGVTGMTIRLRKGTLAGTVLNEVNAESGDIAPAKNSTLQAFADDAPGEATGAVYVLTIQGAGEAAVSTALASSFTARVD